MNIYGPVQSLVGDEPTWKGKERDEQGDEKETVDYSMAEVAA
jgi:hypothetical protein